MSKYSEIQRQLNEVSPIPKGIPKVYLLGDTGTGKTTFIRKILGTESSKFPTTRQLREGANKQVISSQADSLIKISRIWADFFPANTSN
ncbi:hypothetical protein [Klebsiella pneumoniae]|uniref:hypothetical protein n=1 Tax=Klebsiella pneumoniae TaxID=573 RepID=UPI0021C1D3AA|nr:hypothetical protein [Klebsiella pneumoniae]MCT9940582.1 hypothetical protein [Klebsiella pneumoniae]